MKEIRKCISCEKWKDENETIIVSIASEFVPRYSSIDAYHKKKYEQICKECFKIIYPNV